MHVAPRAASASPFLSEDAAARGPRGRQERFGHPRSARLLKPADFAALRGRSRRLGTSHFSAEVMSTEGASARLGQAVSRRVSKCAVDRNRIKRVVRESFRHVRANLPVLDILVIARSSAAEQDNAALRADIARLWIKLAALKAPASAGTMPG
ncbi:MAG TPA: ribonuclease P protein component [Dokdonella sp.]|uniref:ribonuclease P protein component n=1 Tax=Dokdonella sp. TaxID=2291710 RepID=UPI0025C2F62A|nr:ribonuclease P protein component [Dokdonella sp.]MBX3691341.1 ribonuclease P protein component [Dokdonella sp.]MCW5568512.1 ribonuclease P protein component [Dokdonella sp.]HNR90836.1 ribonuclease P protein component [Dokdonella sp.]